MSLLQRFLPKWPFSGALPQAFTLRAVGARSSTTNETVADADDCFNTIAAFVQLLSQAADMNIKRARVAVVAVTPDVVEKLLASDDAIGALRQY